MAAEANEQPADPKAKRAAFASEIASLLAENDSFVAIERIEAEGDPKVIGRRYFDLVVDLYSQRKVAEMAFIGHVGVHFLLTQSRMYAKNDTETANWFKSLAQMTSFNLASNLWPGWGDEGVTISPDQLKVGYDMARLDLRLVEEMKLTPDKLSTATWIIGVHEIAARRYTEAKRRLAQAKRYAQDSGASDTPLMVEGFIAIAEILDGKEPDAGKQRLAAVKASLEKLGTDDAKFYAQQHQDVLKVLSR